MIHHQSVFERWPFEDKSVQAVITSPPYYALRKYDIPDIAIGAWTGQYGLEETYQLYVEHTLLWCREVWRVLKDDGVFFLNIGDSYGTVSGNMHAKATPSKITNTDSIRFQQPNLGMHKCLLDIPARVSIALVDKQGWTKRNNIIWFKPNGMPESVTDRFSKKHENIAMFTKQAKYYFDLEAIREPHKESSIERLGRGISENNKWVMGPDGQAPHGLSQPRLNKKKLMPPIGGKKNADEIGGIYSGEQREWNLKGKNPGDVWVIPTQASSEKHFAMWPQNLVKRMILCSTKIGDIVLDPFCGSGTTLKVAEELGRKGIGIDLGYQDVQKRRLRQIQKPLF